VIPQPNGLAPPLAPRASLGHTRTGSFYKVAIQMTNRLALVLGLVLLILLALDAFFADWANSIYLGRKLVDLIEYLAFWR